MAIGFEIEDRAIGDGARVVVATGEIDLFSAPELEQRVAGAIDAGTLAIVVDLLEVSAIDSSSLGVLIGAHKRLAERGGRLVIACDNPEVMTTLKVTGLDGVFVVEASRDEAVAALDADAAGGAH